jgi:hypothetical protein
MTQYDYPYSDFARDFDAVLPSPNSVALDEMQRLMAVRRYVRATYPSGVDRVERGAALGMAWDFLCRHMAEFDVSGVAVCGEGGTIISEHLLRAVHAAVCSAVLRPLSELPTPAQVRELAEKYNREHETNRPSP